MARVVVLLALALAAQGLDLQSLQKASNDMQNRMALLNQELSLLDAKIEKGSLESTQAKMLATEKELLAVDTELSELADVSTDALPLSLSEDVLATSRKLSELQKRKQILHIKQGALKDEEGKLKAEMLTEQQDNTARLTAALAEAKKKLAALGESTVLTAELPEGTAEEQKLGLDLHRLPTSVETEPGKARIIEVNTKIVTSGPVDHLKQTPLKDEEESPRKSKRMGKRKVKAQDFGKVKDVIESQARLVGAPFAQAIKEAARSRAESLLEQKAIVAEKMPKEKKARGVLAVRQGVQSLIEIAKEEESPKPEGVGDIVKRVWQRWGGDTKASVHSEAVIFQLRLKKRQLMAEKKELTLKKDKAASAGTALQLPKEMRLHAMEAEPEKEDVKQLEEKVEEKEDRIKEISADIHELAIATGVNHTLDREEGPLQDMLPDWLWPWGRNETTTESFECKKKAHVGKLIKQKLRSDGSGMAYYGTVFVGGQPNSAIYDTGSWDNVMLSRCGMGEAEPCCKDTLCPFAAYGSQKSGCWRQGAAGVEQLDYGSGTAWCKNGFDRLAIRGHDNQHYLEVSDFPLKVVVDAAMSLFQNDDKLQSVFGIGMQAAKPGMPLAAMGIKRFLMCFDEDPKADGMIWWNDQERHNDPKWQTLDGISPDRDEWWGQFWLTTTSQWALEFHAVPRHGKRHGKQASEEKVPGCKNGCGAMIDTGTSLITAPAELVSGISEMLDEGHIKDCEDLSAFPTLNFTLGDKVFSLPPQAYIAKAGSMHDLSAEKPDYLAFPLLPLTQADRVRHEEAMKTGTKVDVKACALLLDEDYYPEATPFGDLIIFGMPLLRKYAIQFDSGAGVSPKLRLAEADADCTGYLDEERKFPREHNLKRFGEDQETEAHAMLPEFSPHQIRQSSIKPKLLKKAKKHGKAKSYNMYRRGRASPSPESAPQPRAVDVALIDVGDTLAEVQDQLQSFYASARMQGGGEEV